MKTKFINQNVTVTSVRFTSQFEQIPRRIEFGGRSYNFVDEGIRLSIKSGQRMTRLFDLSDGTQQFRLKREQDERNWQLVSISH